MGTTYSPNLKFPVPQQGDEGWAAVYQAAWALLDSLAPLQQLAVSTYEAPSSSLKVSVRPGSFRKSDGTRVDYAGGSATLAASATTKIWLTDSGTLSTGAAWPSSGTPVVRLATVTAGAGSITAIVDERSPFVSFG